MKDLVCFTLKRRREWEIKWYSTKKRDLSDFIMVALISSEESELSRCCPGRKISLKDL